MAMRYTVTSGEDYRLTLCENDTVKSILQNLSVLFATAKGTVPMYRNFGLSQAFVDKPLAVARVMLLAEVTEAVDTFEPRAKVVGATLAIDGLTGKTVIKVEVEI